MQELTQKKITITNEQRLFLESYKKWGYSDQSSIVRAVLNQLMKEMKRKRRKAQMALKSKKLLKDYTEDAELSAFSSLDSEDFI
jgi:hypothetical protein